MSSPPSSLALHPRTFELVREEQERRAVRNSLLFFLTHCIIHGDEKPPRPIPWESWPYLVERAQEWEDGANEIILKARQLGLSWLVAAYMLWRATYHHWSAAYISHGEDYAREQLDERCRYIWDRLPAHLKLPGKWTADVATFAGGGRIRVFPSTKAAGVGTTNQLVVFDEFAYHANASANWAAIAPTASAGGQTLVLSTADPELGPAGEYHTQWEAACSGVVMQPTDAVGSLRGDRPGVNEFAAVFIAVLARPGRDEAWLASRKARIGDATRADAFYPRSPAEAFVGRAGLVFDMFDRQRHVILNDPETWADCEYRVAGVDPGGGDPTAIVPLGAYRHNGEWRIHQPLEFYQRGAVATEDLATWLLRLHKIAKLDFVVCDAPSDESTLITDLRRFGLPAYKANKSRESRLQEHAKWLANGALTIHHGCVNSIHEYGQYRWSDRTDPNSKEKYKTSTPVDHHADAIDARGYALLSLVQACFQSSKVRRVPIRYKRGAQAKETDWEYVEKRVKQQAEAKR